MISKAPFIATKNVYYIYGESVYVSAEMGHRQVIRISKCGVPFKFFLLGELGVFPLHG